MITSAKAIQQMSERLGWAGGIPIKNAESVANSLSDNPDQDIKRLIELECIKIKAQWGKG
jgi:hypothetical protein